MHVESVLFDKSLDCILMRYREKDRYLRRLDVSNLMLFHLELNNGSSDESSLANSSKPLLLFHIVAAQKD